MVHIAHEEGFAVMSQYEWCVWNEAAIEAGVDSLEHGNYMDEDTMSMLADSDTVWVPTLVTVRNSHWIVVDYRRLPMIMDQLA